MERKRKLNIGGQEVEVTEVGFRSGGENFQEYLADDGSVLRVKLVVTDIFRVDEEAAMTTTWMPPQTAITSSGESVLKKPSEFAIDQVYANEAYPDMVAGIPVTWIEKYASLAVQQASVAEVDPGAWYAEVPGLDGVGSDGDTADDALAGLLPAIIGWVAVKLRAGAYVPPVDGLDLNPRHE